MMKFSDTPGHLKVKDSLRRMIDASRIPHAIMLAGPSGIGKMNVARAFAQYLHCTDRHEGEPCGRCPSCIQHAELNHPDLHFVFPVTKPQKPGIPLSENFLDKWRELLEQDPLMSPEKWLEILDAGNSRPVIYVQEGEEIIRKAALSTFSSDKKVFIIWLPEKMNIETANKLLKVIEEPFDDTVFLLVSNEPNLVLPTIFSRAQRFNMSPLPEDEILGFLRKRFSYDQGFLEQVARISEGRLGKAMSYCREGDESKEFGSFYIEMMRTAYARKVAKLRELSEAAAALGREKLCRFLDYSARMTRENFIHNLHIPALNAMTGEEEAFSSRFSPFIHAGNVQDMAEQIQMAKNDVERNANSKVVMFDFMITLIMLLHRKAT